MNTLRRICDDIGMALTLLTRCPAPWVSTPAQAPILVRALWAYPLIGAFVGASGGAVMMAVAALGGPPLVGALLGLSASVLLTGGLHEDGLADFADGLGACGPAERRLEIMRDSQIGTYGSVALILSFLLRAAALSALLPGWPSIFVWMVSGALGRSGIAFVLAVLPPARKEGQGASVAAPAMGSVLAAWMLAAILSIGLLGKAGLVLIVTAFLVSAGIAGLARRKIGGQTGDVLGATAVIVEVFCLVLASAIGPVS